MTDITIWHNPSCTKSRQTLQLLEERGITPSVRLYLKDAPSIAEIKEALKKLGLSARELMRTKEALYKETGADNETLSEEQLITIMSNNPKLIERPIVFAHGKAAIGRPPELVANIL